MEFRDGALRFGGRGLLFGAIVLASLLVIASVGIRAIALGDSVDSDLTALATVGDHPISRQQVDDAVLRSVSPTQLYDLRKRALDRIIDEYVVDQAAKKAGLPPDQYLQHESSASKVNEADARKFYTDHKAEIDAQVKGQTFDQIKGRIIIALQQRQAKDNRAAIIAKLRQDAHVNILMQPARVKVASERHAWSGGKDAAVTVVEFSDFQCPYCRAAENSVKQIKAKYGDKIKFIYLDFPLGFHEHAMDAARASRCAGDQDKFWQYHDALFADQSKLAAADLKATAVKLGLDGKKFDGCMAKQTPDASIKADLAQGQALGVTGTPTFFINGRQLVGAQPPDKISEIIDDELAGGTKTVANR
ncbi:MAG TPA: thioredoxin domain-containing protein [Candidatus Binataceae bacterium]|nr:thioredoxin domain-containing protein [Candidatus Binataceae bacterium]